MVTTKVLKNGLYGFYNGRKKATAQEVKDFIKLDYQVIDATKLNADQRKYLGAVKGGKSRAENTLVNKHGQFLPKSLQDKALKRLGIDVEAMRRAGNHKELRGVFKDHPELQESFDKLISETGMPFFYDETKILDKIDSYNGDSIFTFNGDLIPNPNFKRGKNNGATMPFNGINITNIIYDSSKKDSGELMPLFNSSTNDRAYKETSKFIKALKRAFKLYYPGVAICLLYIGTDVLIVLMDDECISTGMDSDIRVSDNESAIVQLYHSNN